MLARIRLSLYLALGLLTMVSASALWRLLGRGDDVLFVVGVAGLITVGVLAPLGFQQIRRVK